MRDAIDSQAVDDAAVMQAMLSESHRVFALNNHLVSNVHIDRGTWTRLAVKLLAVLLVLVTVVALLIRAVARL